MEYERIHNLQSGGGLISPSKLRIKLMGHQNQKKKEGSNSNSARTSPSKLEEDTEFMKNSLLGFNGQDFQEEVTSLESAYVKASGSAISDGSQSSQNSYQPRDLIPRDHVNAARAKMQQLSKTESGNSSSVHPMRTLEDDLDNEGYASSSSFEFHKGERSVHNPIGRSLLRPMSSKWNDAEKWIMSRQSGQGNHTKKNNFQNHVTRVPVNENKFSVKRVDSAPLMGIEKFSFVSPDPQFISSQENGIHVPIDLNPQIKDLKEVDTRSVSCVTSSAEESTGPGIRSVCMRDMGTEMTPIPSQEPSRSTTPVGATTPLRSPTSSIPSTPRGVAATSTPIDGDSRSPAENGMKGLSEEELKLKTRKEILALGVQLGKMNIAAWASKDEKEKNAAVENIKQEELRKIEYEKRAAAWAEAEKSRHTARFKREEIKIQAWESQQKAKLDSEMRRIEAKVEQMKAHAQAKMAKKMAMAKQRSEEKRDAADAKKKSQAEKLISQAEYIRQTGRIPSSSYLCCGWS